MNRRHVAAVLRRELLDIRRERRVLSRLVAQPFIFLLLLSAPALFVQQAQSREQSSAFTVAVEGDIDAIDGLREALDRRPFDVSTVDDAELAIVARNAEAAVRIDRNAARLVREGRTVPIELLIFSTQDVTERALPTLTQRLNELAQTQIERALDEAGRPVSLALPVVLASEDVATTSAEGIRFSLAQGLPVVLVIQLYGLVGLVEARIGGAKDRRTLEALLVLPARRGDLLTGIGISGALVGTISSLLIFVPVVLILATAVASLSRSLAEPLVLVTTLGIGAALIALTFAAMGLWLGARAGTGGEGSVTVTLAQLTVFGAAVIVPFLDEVRASGPILAAPVIGPVLFVRDGVASGAALVDVAVLVAGQFAVAAVLFGLAVRGIEKQRSLLRTTKA